MQDPLESSKSTWKTSELVGNATCSVLGRHTTSTDCSISICTLPISLCSDTTEATSKWIAHLSVPLLASNSARYNGQVELPQYEGEYSAWPSSRFSSSYPTPLPEFMSRAIDVLSSPVTA